PTHGARPRRARLRLRPRAPACAFLRIILHRTAERVLNVWRSRFSAASARAREGRSSVERRRSTMRIRALVVTAAALLAGGAFAIPGAQPAVAGIDPAQFTSPVANPYFPLKPGTVFVYRGSEGRQHLVEHLRITHRTKQIEGVTTVVISDVLF